MELEYCIATDKNIDLIKQLIFELATYEKRADVLSITTEDLQRIIADKTVEILIAFKQSIAVGFVSYHIRLKSILGGYCMYMDDIYIRPEYQKKGYALAIEKEACRIALENHCLEIEWKCFEWNRMSIDFCLGVGAHPVSDCIIYHLSSDAMQKLVEP